jgi:hypothetical protein
MYERSVRRKCSCVFLCWSGWAGARTGQHRDIFGKAVDDSNAVLPGVSVTLSGPSLISRKWR